MNSLTPHQSKALNIQSSISLTANAGSGKTFVLAQRFLQIILTTNTPLSKIAAITFTEKAASELYKRISIELEVLARSIKTDELKRKVEKIRKQLVSAKISTIHSFCIDLLKEFPVETSLDANFLTINEQKSDELIDISIQNTIKELLRDSDNNSDIKTLIRLLGSTTLLASELSTLIKKRNTIHSLLEKYYSESEDKIATLLFSVFEEKIKSLFDEELLKALNQLRKINEHVLDIKSDNEIAIEIESILKKIKSESDIQTIISNLKELSEILLTGKLEIRKQGYLSSKDRDGLQDSINIVEGFFSGIKELEINAEHKKIELSLAKYVLALINVFHRTLNSYENKKSELGVLDFEDILIHAKNLLDNNPIKEALAGKFSYLLIDEYQDTNEIQYDIFLPILDNLKNGNLFVVGDEKQSIYRFRDADLQVFSRTKSDIQEIHGEDSLLTLPDSFRMAPAICLLVNSVFKNLFKEPNPLFNEVSATDLVCARSDDFIGKIEIIISANDKESEAELIANKIIQLKNNYFDRIKEWNDIVVLVRKRASFSELQKAFINYRIPFNLIGGTGFYQRQSISDIYNYFAFLLNDKDDVSLIGLLRSPFYLVSDAKIMELSELPSESYWEKIASAAQTGNYYWKKIFDSINQNKVLSARTSIPVLLRKILRETNFISVICTRNDGVQEISNLNKLITITNDFFAEEFRTLYDYVSFLKDSIEGIQDEAQGRIDPGTVGVNIMTIHQAKGLEYSAVFLYNCNETSQLNKVKSKSFTVDKEFGILTKVPINDNYFGNYWSAPIVGLYNVFEDKKQRAELKRLLYVGLTRAKDFLIISSTERNQTSTRDSFLSLLKEGMQNDFSGDEINLNDELTFLEKRNDGYLNISKNINLKIPVVRELELTGNRNVVSQIQKSELRFYLSDIPDQSKGEVISATRYSTFSSCPMKYNMIYNYKMAGLIQQSKHFNKNYKTSFRKEYNKNELESYLLDDHFDIEDYSKIKGDLIHYILKRNVEITNLNYVIELKLKKYFRDVVPDELLEDIIIDLGKYFNSDFYQWINSFPIYYNEFEAYLAEKDYYLLGILDKLILDEDKIIIIDYKTDNITEEEVELRSGKYLPQLKFYAYIVSRLFPKITAIEGRIVFIKHPDKSYKFIYNNDDDKRINSGINMMITSIRNNNYSLNSDECTDCIFAEGKNSCTDYIPKPN